MTKTTPHTIESVRTGDLGTWLRSPTLADALEVVADVTEHWRIRDAATLAVVAEGNRPSAIDD